MYFNSWLALDTRRVHVYFTSYFARDFNACPFCDFNACHERCKGDFNACHARCKGDFNARLARFFCDFNAGHARCKGGFCPCDRGEGSFCARCGEFRC